MWSSDYYRDDSHGRGELSSEILSLIEELKDCYNDDGVGDEDKIKKIIDRHYTNELERKRLWDIYKGRSSHDNQKREFLKNQGIDYDESWLPRAY